MNSLSSLLEAWKNHKIGFTNGCFDMLHEGHRHLLRKGREHCDILFVAVNDDKSVKALKGKGRPVQPLEKRVGALFESKLIDGLSPFSTEEDLLELVMKIRPEVLIKGADYVGLGITGDKWVERNGGRVILIPLLEGFSTSKIVRS